jgi:ketosteroid isomerase-like protein
MGVAESKQLVADAFARWEKGEGTPFEVVAEDMRWTITGNSKMAGTWTSKAAFGNEVLGPIMARLQGNVIRPSVQSITAEGDTVVVHWKGSATALDGVAYDNEYCWIMRVDGDQVVEVVAWFDSHALDGLVDRVPLPA